VRDIKGYDAILLAANNGLRKVVEVLLEKGADVNSGNEFMFTPLHLAAYKGYAKIVDVLLKHPKVKINAKTENQVTALQLASKEGHIETVQVLLNNKRIDVDAQDVWEETALHYAARNGHLDVVEALIANGVNLNLQGYQNFTPLGAAVINKQEKVAEVLKAHGAKEVTREDFDAAFARAKEYNDTGNELMKRQQYKKARELFQKSIDEGIDFPYPYYNLYLIVFNNDKNYPEALNLLNKAIDMDPKIPLYYYQQGRVFQKLNQQEEALKSFRKYIEMEPNSEEAKKLKAEFPDL